MRRSLLLAISLAALTACGPTIVDAGAATAGPPSDDVVDDEPDADTDSDSADTDGVDPIEPTPTEPAPTEPEPTEPTEPEPTEPTPPEASPSPSSTTGSTTTEPITRTIRTLQWNIAGGKENTDLGINDIETAITFTWPNFLTTGQPLFISPFVICHCFLPLGVIA